MVLEIISRYPVTMTRPLDLHLVGNADDRGFHPATLIGGWYLISKPRLWARCVRNMEPRPAMTTSAHRRYTSQLLEVDLFVSDISAAEHVTWWRVTWWKPKTAQSLDTSGSEGTHRSWTGLRNVRDGTKYPPTGTSGVSIHTGNRSRQWQRYGE